MIFPQGVRIIPRSDTFTLKPSESVGLMSAVGRYQDEMGFHETGVEFRETRTRLTQRLG